jgi:hypothetical protein
MESTAQNTFGWRTPAHKGVSADLDRSMERGDYAELLGHIALAYKELTDAMAAQRSESAVRPFSIATAVSILREAFSRGPSPTRCRKTESQTRLSQAERQLGRLVSCYLPAPCSLFDPAAQQLVLPELTYRMRPA